MAEGRKNPAASKVATPKVGGGQKDIGDMSEVLHKAVGARVKVTVAPQNINYEGTLFAASPEMNIIAINTASTSPNPTSSSAAQAGDFHVIPVSHLLNFTVLSAAERAEGATDGFDRVQPTIDRLDIKALKQREEAAVRKLKEKQAQQGKGVSKDAQDLFDNLARTLPCRWHDKTIVVNEVVLIEPPYHVENCKAPKDKAQAVSRVKVIVESFYARKKATVPPNRSAVATPIPPRKGG